MSARFSPLSRSDRQSNRPSGLAAAGLLLLLAACTMPLPRVNEAHTRPPSWQRSPLSWEKLEEVERWLDSPASDVAPHWRVEGQLVLSEGRMSYAEQDLTGAGSSSSVVRARLELARHGFEDVLRDPDASRDQSSRAQRGLDKAKRLAGGPVRASASLPGGVISRSTWGASAARPNRLDQASKYWRITVHHSAMPDAPVLTGSAQQAAAEVRRIQYAHVNGRNFGDVGYHFLIDPAGHVFEGRDLRWQGAHARGENNVGNVGICLLGNFDHERPTPAALVALKKLVGELQARLGIARNEVHSHLDFGGTACPGKHLHQFVEREW